MENKNIVSGNGSATLITVPFDHNFTQNDAILHIKRIKELFHNFIICLRNIELLIFTSPTKRFLDEIEYYSHNSKPAEDIDRFISMYDNFVIFWNDKDECRLIPNSVGSGKLFKRVKLERASHKSSTVNVSPGSLLHERCSHSERCGTAASEITARQLTGVKYNNRGKDYERSVQNMVSLKYLKSALRARNELSFVYPVSGGFPTQESSTEHAEDSRTFVSNNGSLYQFPIGSVGGHTSSREDSLIAEASGLAIGRQTRLPRYSEYVDVSARLRTYARWVRQSPNPRQLAEAGFFFTNEVDLVRCFQCGLGLKDFSVDDDPLLEHVRHSGDCEHLYDYLGPSQLAEIKRIVRGLDAEQSRQLQLQHHSRDIPEVNYTCRHPQYRTLEARLATFDKWPRSIVQTPRLLADAGLYYTGFEDHVRCFACDGGLRRWDAEDDPWTEHCRWFPSCPFARQQKGDEYIALVQASVSQEYDETTTTGAADLTQTLAQITLKDPQFQVIMSEHKRACLEMGFKENDFNDTVQELRNRGNIKPALEDIVDNIAIVVENREAAKRIETIQNETPQEENRRLKKFFMCMVCEENKVNVLFLPCTHHRLCMECAKPLTKCPVCDRDIREKIKTFLV